MTASIPPKPLPRNLRPPAGRRPLQAIGGKTGLAVFLMLASSVLVLGWIAWEKYGHAIQKVFATNRSSHYASREEFFASRIEEVANASPERKFAFASSSLGKNLLKVYREGEMLVLDASDVKTNREAVRAAEEMPEFAAPQGDAQELKIRFAKPWDSKKIARAAAQTFEAVLDGAPAPMVDKEGHGAGEITFNDWKEPHK